MKPAAAVAVLVLAAGVFAAGALAHREYARRVELTRNAAPFCLALTREGLPCRNRTREGYCWRHRPQAAARLVAVR